MYTICMMFHEELCQCGVCDCEWQRSVTSLAISEVDIWSWPGFPPIIRIPNWPAHKTKTSKNNWKHKKIEHIDMKSLKIQQSGKRYGCEVFRGENSIGSNVYPEPRSRPKNNSNQSLKFDKNGFNSIFDSILVNQNLIITIIQSKNNCGNSIQ